MTDFHIMLIVNLILCFVIATLILGTDRWEDE